jgi:hypothetical protein
VPFYGDALPYDDRLPDELYVLHGGGVLLPRDVLLHESDDRVS